MRSFVYSVSSKYLLSYFVYGLCTSWWCVGLSLTTMGWAGPFELLSADRMCRPTRDG